MKQPATKQNIAKRLKRLSATMLNIAVDMDYYGGFAYWARNSGDLAGASKMAEEWSEEIMKEVERERK
jgi:hypothetical protein